jgi:hypothetical protein
MMIIVSFAELFMPAAANESLANETNQVEQDFAAFLAASFTAVPAPVVPAPLPVSLSDTPLVQGEAAPSAATSVDSVASSMDWLPVGKPEAAIAEAVVNEAAASQEKIRASSQAGKSLPSAFPLPPTKALSSAADLTGRPTAMQVSDAIAGSMPAQFELAPPSHFPSIQRGEDRTRAEFGTETVRVAARLVKFLVAETGAEKVSSEQVIAARPMEVSGADLPLSIAHKVVPVMGNIVLPAQPKKVSAEPGETLTVPESDWSMVDRDAPSMTSAEAMPTSTTDEIVRSPRLLATDATDNRSWQSDEGLKNILLPPISGAHPPTESLHPAHEAPHFSALEPPREPASIEIEKNLEDSTGETDPSLSSPFLPTSGASPQAAPALSRSAGPAPSVLSQTVPSFLDLVQQTPQQETRSLRFSLHPHELGRVEIEVTRDAEGRVSASLNADQLEAAHSLTQGIHHLRESLEQAGLVIEHLEVVTTPHSQTNTSGQQQQTPAPQPTPATNQALTPQPQEENLTGIEEEKLLNLRA